MSHKRRRSCPKRTQQKPYRPSGSERSYPRRETARRRNQDKPRRINETANILAVFWACEVLSRAGKDHTLCNVGDCIRHAKLSPNTIRAAFRRLEAWGAIKYPFGDSPRKGRRWQWILNPFKIPRHVVNQRPGRTTAHVWKKHFEETQLAKWKAGVQVYNGEFFRAVGVNPLVKIARWAEPILKVLTGEEPNVTFDEEWIIQQINESPLILEARPLRSFYHYICLQFLFTPQLYINNPDIMPDLERLEKVFRRCISFSFPELYVEIAPDRSVIVVGLKGA